MQVFTAISVLCHMDSKLQNQNQNQDCNIPVCLGAWVKCYPTYEHAQHSWEVRAQIVDLKVEDGYFNGCTVRYFDRKKQQEVEVKLAGGSGNWLLANLS